MLARIAAAVLLLALAATPAAAQAPFYPGQADSRCWSAFRPAAAPTSTAA